MYKYLWLTWHYSEWVNEWVSQWVSEWVSQWVNESASQRVNESVSEIMSQRVSETDIQILDGAIHIPDFILQTWRMWDAVELKNASVTVYSLWYSVCMVACFYQNVLSCHGLHLLEVIKYRTKIRIIMYLNLTSFPPLVRFTDNIHESSIRYLTEVDHN